MKPRLNIGGVPVDPVTFDEAILRCEEMLADGEQHVIVTPNPEMAVRAAKDEEFSRILWKADLALADGYGLKLMANVSGRKIPEVVTGVDFALALAGIAEQEHCSVYLLGGGEGIAERAAERLRKHYPKLKIAGAESGGRIRYDHGEWRQDEGLLDRIRKEEPVMLLVALGHGKQERWIRDHLKELPSVRLAIGIGGALDFISGKVRRAPGLMRKVHLEWFWRLLRQPWRIFRILTALILFPLLVVFLLLRRK